MQNYKQEKPYVLNRLNNVRSDTTKFGSESILGFWQRLNRIEALKICTNRDIFRLFGKSLGNKMKISTEHQINATAIIKYNAETR